MKFLMANTFRTNNFTDSDIQTKFRNLMQENEDFIQRATDTGEIVAVIYHDYESDYKGDYSVSIGKEAELDYVFDTSKYSWKEYPVPQFGDLALLDTWKKVWSDEEALVIQRVYDFDFEKYSPNGVVSIFIAVQHERNPHY